MGLTVEELPTHEAMVSNILKVYSEADADNIERGKNWYAETLEFCTTWSMGYDVERAAAAYAVISPSLDKEQNDKQFVRGITAHKLGMDITKIKIGVYGRKNREKFARCLDGDLTAVGGRKVTSFYNNIMGKESPVTVDRWAVRIALYEPKMGEDKCVPNGKHCYETIRNAYISAAQVAGVSPHVMQAITWEVWRGRYYRRSQDDYKNTRGR
jgi:hypothetical protein